MPSALHAHTVLYVRSVRVRSPGVDVTSFSFDGHQRSPALHRGLSPRSAAARCMTGAVCTVYCTVYAAYGTCDEVLDPGVL
jgi:hypothetical protein